MKDIEKRTDIVLLIDEFYKKVLVDESIGFIFKDIVALNWDTHIPIMYDFWESILHGQANYKGNPMIKHLELSKKVLLNKTHFDKWLQLWSETNHSLFKGPKSEEAISRATSIGGLMLHKINQSTLK